MGSHSGTDTPARFHNKSRAVSMCAAKSPRIQRSWMQCAPMSPSPAASARSNSIARSRSDRVRSGRSAGCISSLEQAHDALVLLDVPAVLVVVFRDRHRIGCISIRLPDAWTLHGRVGGCAVRAAQLIELYLHSGEHTVELGD